MIMVVGSGISGAVIAERYANKGEKVIVIEKRNHIGGNCYDFSDSNGLLVPLYGPHFFHTNDKSVWDYIKRFSEWNRYEHRVLSSVDGKLVPIPVNITTVNEIFGTSIEDEGQMIHWLENNTEKIGDPANSEESALARVGRVLFEKMFKNYTKKQWDSYPHELDAQVMNRIPVRTNYDDRYFTDAYQAMPVAGYTELFQNMLTHPNIEVILGIDIFEKINEFGGYSKLFFTGRIDQFFQNSIKEKLEYRSLRFEFETIEKEWFQCATTINYPNDFPYTRITEPKHSTGQNNPKSVIIKEYPTWEGEPYYPVFNKKNAEIYNKYQAAATELIKDNIYFVGRLANYKYFNMDAAFANALGLFYEIEG